MNKIGQSETEVNIRKQIFGQRDRQTDRRMDIQKTDTSLFYTNTEMS